MTETTTGAAPARTERPGTQRGRIGRPFQKGNPGKPKGARMKSTLVGIEVTRAMSGRAAERLAALVDSRSHRIAFEAARLVLAYAWGLPKATLELSGGIGDLSKELSLALTEARARWAEVEAGRGAQACLQLPQGNVEAPAADAPVLEEVEVEKAETEGQT
jgi:hypothetical protein